MWPVFYARRNIEPNEELTYSYVPGLHYPWRVMATTQSISKENVLTKPLGPIPNSFTCEGTDYITVAGEKESSTPKKVTEQMISRDDTQKKPVGPNPDAYEVNIAGTAVEQHELLKMHSSD